MNIGIAADTIKFKNVTIQSNKYVVVREEGKNSLAIVDTATKNVLRLPVQVDSAIMNPVTKVVGLRGMLFASCLDCFQLARTSGSFA